MPLNPQACAILNDLRAWQEARLRDINEGRKKKKWELKIFSEWVFPSPRGDSPYEWEQRATARIRSTSGIEFRPLRHRPPFGGLADRTLKLRDKLYLKLSYLIPF